MPNSANIGVDRRQVLGAALAAGFAGLTFGCGSKREQLNPTGKVAYALQSAGMIAREQRHVGPKLIVIFMAYFIIVVDPYRFGLQGNPWSVYRKP